jgi:hypothetical protein
MTSAGILPELHNQETFGGYLFFFSVLEGLYLAVEIIAGASRVKLCKKPNTK